jgi:stearoyl-CoA desaturase (delta-9 desaturase)
MAWGFVVSTVALFHGVATINSLSHVYGKRRFKTSDDSRNNFWLALITMGEGWHNNHHHYPNSARQGFYWWEIDLSYYGLKALKAVGLVRDLKPVPARILAEGRGARVPALNATKPVGATARPEHPTPAFASEGVVLEGAG